MVFEYKPKDFGFAGKEVAFDQYVKTVKAVVGKLSNKSHPVKYMIALVEHANGEINDVQMKKISSATSLNATQKKNIQKYFGEVVGPIWTTRNNIFGDTPDPKKCLVFHPAKANAPLTDYEIRIVGKGGEKTAKSRQTDKRKSNKANSMLRSNRISAKSGATTNTVKAADILTVLRERNGVNEENWKGSTEEKLFEVLAESSTSVGPLSGAVLLTEKGIIRNYVPVTTLNKIVSALTSGGTAKLVLGKSVEDILTDKEVQTLKPVLEAEKSLSHFINKQGKVVTLSNKEALIVGYICVAVERYLQKVSEKSDRLELEGMFSDAVGGIVNYVEFTVDSTNYPVWKHYGKKELSKIDGYLRSKNSLSTRLAKRGMADSLGFQPIFG
jgi:hypothetical protein